MAELAEKGLGEGTHVFVVVDDQDAADKGRVLRPGLSRRLTSGRLLVAAGEHDGDGRALSGRALYEHVAAGLGREAIDLTETEARALADAFRREEGLRSEEHTSELQSLMRISYAVFCLK